MLPFFRKLGSGLITLWGISLVVFFLLFVVPGWGKEKPADAMAQTMAGARANEDNIAAIKEKFGLDKPLFFNWNSQNGILDAQYPRFLGAALTNNLRSYRNGDKVFSAIWRRFPATILLAITALIIYLAAAIPIALFTAKSAGRFSDRAWLFLSLFAISMPTFWLGRILQHYLGYETGLFSVGGAATLANLPLPALTLGIGGAAYYSRLLHANLTGEMKQDYIRAARARGLAEKLVLAKHALKNALIPVVAILGLEFASLLSGLIFTEKIFGWPGIGSLAVDSVSNNDVPMIMGTVLFAGAMVIGANVLVDVVYRVIDPRVRAS